MTRVAFHHPEESPRSILAIQTLSVPNALLPE